MDSMNRRSALGLAVTAVALSPVIPVPANAAGQRYGADAGEQVAPGVRRVDLSKRKSEIAAYANVSMVDLVFQPKSKFSNPSMASDMVCHCLEGELAVDQGPGMPETTENRGDSVAIMRITPLTT